MGWLEQSLELVLDSLDSDTANAISMFKNIWGGVDIKRIRDRWTSNAFARWGSRVDLHDGAFYQRDFDNKEYLNAWRADEDIYETIVHELSHIWDQRSDQGLSDNLRDVVGGRFAHKFLWFEWGEYTVDIPTSWTTFQENPENPAEDWAYTFSAFVVDSSRMISPERVNYVLNAIDEQR